MTARPCVHVVDTMMVNRAGHHHHMTVELSAALAARGWDARLYVPRAADPAVRALATAACLDHVPRTRIYPMPEADIGAVNLRFQQDLAGFAGDIAPDDTVFFPLAGHRTLFGILGWMEAMEPRRRPRVALMLAAAECFADLSGTVHDRNSRIFRTVCRALCDRLADGNRPPPLFFAPSMSYADHLTGLLDGAATVRAFPYSFQRRDPRAAPEPAARPPLIGLLGSTGWVQKGLDRFLDAARLLLADGADVRVLVQVDFTFDPDGAERLAVHRAVLGHPATTVLSGPLAPEAYDAQLRRCALVVLPYGPAYRRQPSGILFEALHRGRPVVLPAGTEIARDAAALNVRMPSFAEWSGTAVATAIRDGLERYPFYAEEARRAAGLLDGQPAGGERLADALTGNGGA